MSGVADAITLFDKDGKPVAVKLVDGEQRLVVVDEQLHREMQEIKLLLGQILEHLNRSPL